MYWLGYGGGGERRGLHNRGQDWERGCQPQFEFERNDRPSPIELILSPPDVPSILDLPYFPFHNIFFAGKNLPSKIPRFLNFPKRPTPPIMAVNTSNKKAIADIILPQVEFKVTTTGVTITSERLNTPRFLPFNQPGQCRSCKSTDLELDHVITKEGVTLFSNRIKVS